MFRTIQTQKGHPMSTHPTQRTYSSLDAAYDHFNRELFAGTLPACLITMQRHKGAYGYFSGGRFASTDNPQEVTDEIALNPAHFASRPTAGTLSTLVHEMAHLWQHHFGKPSRTGYHNREWAAKMREIGLIPTETGQPGGKEIGQKVTHYIEPGGRFDRACTAYLATGTAFLYHDRAGDGEAATTRKKKAASKTKYTCPTCGQNAWAKPAANLVCGDCRETMEADQAEETEE
jgi:predicted SprT family Zn-dependent metalloprotease